VADVPLTPGCDVTPGRDVTTQTATSPRRPPWVCAVTVGLRGRPQGDRAAGGLAAGCQAAGIRPFGLSTYFFADPASNSW
jgi:hypothetical protein